jgi:hypothetical protein
MGAGALLLGAILGVIKGAVPLKAGASIDRRKDPLGFWVTILCLTGLGLFVLREAIR